MKEELKRLETVDRKEVISRISHAASHGDLKENAGYHAAKDDQGFIEDRIKRLTSTINQAEVIEGKNKDTVQIGSVVSLKSEGGQDKYQIVEPEESDIMAGKISFKSSLGEALLGKKKGDVVKFNTPGGAKEYKIINLE